jgi:ParB/RepB/Spo0J family partition protein
MGKRIMNAPETLPLAADAQEFQFVAPALLHPSPTNPRRSFPESSLAEMAESVAKHGVLQPILVRPWPEGYKKISKTAAYEIIAGERRYRASLLAKLDAIPVMVRHLDDTAVLEFQIIENLQREDVHPLEEAEGYQVLMLRTGYTADQLAEKVGKSKAYIYARLKLCAIGGKAREAFMAGELSASIALLIARIPIPALQERAAKEITEGRYHGSGPMSAREAADHVQEHYMLRLAEAPFPRGDAKLVEGVPTCAKCPKRSGNARELYPDVKSADVCTDPDCFAAKKAAHAERQIEAAKAQGLKVLEGKAAEKVLPYAGAGIQNHSDLKDGWVQADKTVYEAPYDDGYPSWRKLLGEDWKPTAIIVDPRGGQTVELMQEKDARAAAEAKGVTFTRNGRGERSEAEKKLEKQKKEETAYRTLLLERILEAAQGKSLAMPDLVEIAQAHWERLWFEHQKTLAKLLVGKPNRDGVDEVGKAIGKSLDPRMILTACCLASQVNVINSYGFKPGEKPERMLGFAKRLGVDAEAVREECTPAPDKGKGPAKADAARQARYRHPNNDATWSGRGKQPKWVQEWLEAGNTLEELEQGEKPAAAMSDPGDPLIGARVRIKADVRGPSGMKRKCCGREGTIESCEGDGAYYTVRFGPKAHEIVTNLVWNEFDLIAKAEAAE